MFRLSIVRNPLHKGGGSEIFTRNGGKPGMGGWFYNAGYGKFLKFLDIVDRGVLTPLLYEDLPILPFPLFQMLSTPPPPQFPCHLQPPPTLFFLLSCFFSWMGDPTTFDVLFYLTKHTHNKHLEKDNTGKG